MYLETKRILIRDFKPEDAADLHEILGDAETMKHCEPAYSFEKTKSFLTEFCIAKKGAVAAVHKESNKVIGYILFHFTEESVYEIGWFFNKPKNPSPNAKTRHAPRRNTAQPHQKQRRHLGCVPYSPSTAAFSWSESASASEQGASHAETCNFLWKISFALFSCEKNIIK